MAAERSWERHFRALHAGDSTFEEFARATRPLWLRLAAQIHRRWRMPKWHSEEETVQNLLLGAWKFAWAYDPAKDTRRKKSIQAFVIWNAYDKAKKAAHSARGVTHKRDQDGRDRPDRAPSHIERPLSAYGDEGDDGGDQAHAVERLMFDGGAYTPADQEQRLIDEEERRSGAYRAWGYSSTHAEMRALEALADARTLEEAAARVWGDVQVRVELKLTDPADAERVVRRAAKAVAERITRAA